MLKDADLSFNLLKVSSNIVKDYWANNVASLEQFLTPLIVINAGTGNSLVFFTQRE